MVVDDQGAVNIGSSTSGVQVTNTGGVTIGGASAELIQVLLDLVQFLQNPGYLSTAPGSPVSPPANLTPLINAITALNTIKSGS